MQTPAVGDGPVVFFTEQGQQLSIPLSAIYFENDAVQSRVTANGLQEWLNYLVLQGQLTPGRTPVAKRALTFKAATAGPAGNEIKVDVREIGAEAVEIKVTEAQAYKNLTFDSVLEVLGSAEGLVRATAVTATGADVPAEGLVAPTQVGTAAARAIWEIEALPAGSAKGATLEARSLGSEKGAMTVLVEDVDPVAKTFTLNFEWVGTLNVVPADLSDVPPLADLMFAVTVDSPSPGTVLHLPRPGHVSLEGGAERIPSVPAKKASVTLLTDE